MNRYKAVKIDGKKRDYHRYIMEQELGRKLRPDEVVHHKNNDSKDNRIENLEVMLLSEHTRLHHANRKQSLEVRKAQSERMKGKPNKNARHLSEDQVRYVKENYIPGDNKYGLRAMSRELGISHTSLIHILHKRSYKDID